jgi:DNA-binding NarL/FixJ family response regulator
VIKKNILVVDDSPAVRHAIRFVLEKVHRATICSEAKDAFDAIAKAAVLHPDLILVDLAAPKLRGATAASILKQFLPGVPIFLFAMYEDAVEAPVIGVDAVLSKQDGFDHLVQRVQELLYPTA